MNKYLNKIGLKSKTAFENLKSQHKKIQKDLGNL